MSELQTLESIIEGKPDGATHQQDMGKYYYKIIGNAWYIWVKTYQGREKKDKLGWGSVYGLMPMRSLADIQAQIDLHKEVAALKHELSLDEEVRKERDYYAGLLNDKVKEVEALRERLASAKAEGIREAITKCGVVNCEGGLIVNITCDANSLFEYAEQIEGKN